MKRVFFYGIFLICVLCCCTSNAKQEYYFWGTPEWDVKVKDFSFSPKEAAKILYCEMQKGRKSIADLKSYRDLGVLLCICNDEYVFTNKMPGPSEKWSISGFYVNGYTGHTRLIVYSCGNPDQYVSISHNNKNLPGFPFPLEGYPLYTLSLREWYQLVNKACLDFPKKELKEWADNEWEEMKKLRKDVESLVPASILI